LHHSAAVTNLGAGERAHGRHRLGLRGRGRPERRGRAAADPALRIAGAAVGSLLAELAYTALLWRTSLRTSSVRFDTRAVLGVLAAYVLGACALLASAAALPAPASALARIAIALLAIAWIAQRVADAPLRSALGELALRLGRREGGDAGR
jgi:hypothetical protein